MDKEKKVKNNKKENFNRSILYVGSEVQPFCQTGGLADVMGSLPKALKEKYSDSDVRVVMPLYKNMNIDRNKLLFIGNTYVSLSWRKEYCGVFTYKLNNVQYYFLDNEKYFKRDGYYGYMDDAERFAFFSKAVLGVLPIMDFFPDIIHVNDWQSALIPAYLKICSWNDERYNNIKTVLTIHNIIYQGRYGSHILSDVLGFDKKHSNIFLHHGDVNFVKAGMICCDKVVTVSPTYAKEIQTFEGGVGLDDVARNVSHKLVGIVNGLDYDFYNPSTDKDIWQNYDSNSIDSKIENKKELQKQFGLELDLEKPILCYVHRMVKNKGIDIIKEILENVLNTTDAQFVAVGEGEKEYEDYFKYLNFKYPGKARISLGFDSKLGRKIYAGSDILLMPSASEPCGLSQIVASRYGVVSIVREVGGLKDTIKDFGCPEGGNGYTFSNYNGKDLEYSIKRAINDYKDKKEWKNKIAIVMNKDFSWEHSMDNYVEIYKKL